MTNEEFLKLCQPVNTLIGYAMSASDITDESDIKRWSKRLIEHAEALAKAWQETALTEPGDH